MQPGIERAARHRTEQRDQDLCGEQYMQRRCLVRHEDEKCELPVHESRDAHRDDRDLAALAELLDERDPRQLRDLREEGKRREDTYMQRRRAELEREADQDHAAIEGADHARPGGVLDERALAALDVRRSDLGIGCKTHLWGTDLKVCPLANRTP